MARPMKLDRESNRADQRRNVERLDEFQTGMEELQASPNKNIKKGRAGYIYKQLQQQLKEQGFVKELDIHLVNLLAIHIDMYYQAYEEVSEHGIQQAIYKCEISPTGEIINEHAFQGYKKNPAVDTLNMCTNQIKTISEKLGMTPTSRASMLANIKVDDKPKETIQDVFNSGVGW